MSPELVAADPCAAICAYLAATLSDLLAQGPSGPAVFRPSLPQAQDRLMPQACIVVRPAGGYKLYGVGALPVADPVLDLTCYGAVSQQSYELTLAAARVLRALRMSVWEQTKLFWCRIAGGPIPLPDNQTLWPACWLGVQVMHAEAAEG